MNTKVILLLLGLSSIVLFSCSTKQPIKPAILIGKVDVNWSKTIKLSNGAITLTDSWIDRLNVGDSIINLEADGSFKIKLPIEKPDFYTLSHEYNEVELFISPNDSLYIDFNSETVASGTSEKVVKLCIRLSLLSRLTL